jgi:hypothetical protein
MTIDPSLLTDSAFPDRRRFLLGAPALLAGTSGLTSCSQEAEPESSNAVAAKARRPVSLSGIDGATHIQKVGSEPARELTQELIRLATLAPSSHNTQCWKFSVEDKAITILPNLSQRCPAVDPDDHHLFVSLGCAVENLLLTERTAMEQVLDYVVQGNTAQMADRAFVKELKTWFALMARTPCALATACSVYRPGIRRYPLGLAN